MFENESDFSKLLNVNLLHNESSFILQEVVFVELALIDENADDADADDDDDGVDDENKGERYESVFDVLIFNGSLVSTLLALRLVIFKKKIKY